MNGYLRQSTASQVRTIGPFIDDTDFKTLENGLTIANTDILIKKNGGASAAKNSGGATADGSGGLYHLTWDATDTATVGELHYSVTVAGALTHWGTYVVLEEPVYDALFAASAPGYVVDQPVNVTKWLGTAAATPNVAGTPVVDLVRLNGNSNDVVMLGAAAGWLNIQNKGGTAVTGTLSTTQATTDLTGLGDDVLNHAWAILFWEGAAQQQARIVTDYVSATGLITFAPALSAAPANGDGFILIPAASGLAVGDRTGTVTDVQNRLSVLVTKTATVQTDGGNSATQILTDLTETEVNHWRYSLVKITSGALAQQIRKCTGYDGAGTLTFTDGFTDVPADGTTIELIND